MPSISIVMPAYNAERYLIQSIRSVQDQTYADWELIVVDDGSSDATAAIVREFAAREPRLRYVFQENRGQAGARNTGIRAALGEWIAFLDADDLWLPEKLTRQWQAVQETDPDVVFTGGFIFTGEDAGDETAPYPTLTGTFQGPDFVNRLFQRNVIANLSVLARKKALARAGMLNEDRRLQNCEDYDLWLRLAEDGAAFLGLPDRLFRYRRHAHSVTAREAGLLRPDLEVLRRHADWPGLSPEVRRRRLRSACRALTAALLREEDYAGAAACLDELATRWDRGGRITQFQRQVLRRLPRQFNRIMRPLYAASGFVKALKASLSRR